ncbi:hypothetical protein HYY75_06600 [bacterium]|nr:hypothetical protein [bacterium]
MKGRLFKREAIVGTEEPYRGRTPKRGGEIQGAIEKTLKEKGQESCYHVAWVKLGGRRGRVGAGAKLQDHTNLTMSAAY